MREWGVDRQAGREEEWNARRGVNKLANNEGGK